MIKLAVLTIERYYYSYRMRKAYQERLEIIRRMKANQQSVVKEAKRKVQNVMTVLHFQSRKGKGFGLRHQNTKFDESEPTSIPLKRSFSQTLGKPAFRNETQRILPLAKTINQRLVLSKAKTNNFKQLEHTTVKLMPNDINCLDPLRNTPLFYAASHGNKDFCHYLIEKGAIVNLACQGGDTALHMAFKSGNRATVELLLIHKANPNALNQYNQTPISYGNKILVNVMGLENAIALTERRDVVFDNRPLIDTVSHDQITKSLRNKDNWSEKSNSTLMLSVSKEDRKRLKTYSEASTAEWTFRTK